MTATQDILLHDARGIHLRVALCASVAMAESFAAGDRPHLQRTALDVADRAERRQFPGDDWTLWGAMATQARSLTILYFKYL